MPTPPGSVKVAPGSAWSALVIITTAAWFLRGYVWPTLSNVEVDALRAMLDPALFRRDFAVQELLHFGPRFYYNELVLLPARAGLPLAWSFALWHVVALGLLLAGVRALARTAGLGAGATAILVVWLLVTGIGTLGGVFLYTNAPVPAVWAGALLPWAALLAWRGRWTAAFACCGAAALLQFLVGFYAGALVLAALLWLRRGRGLVTALPWVVGLALVYGPMAATGGTGVLDNDSLVHIYAQVRLPHHLVPSAWGWAFWVQAGAFYAGAWWLLQRTRSGRPAGESVVLAGALGLMALALAVNHVFVEVYPLALVAKLQPARITPLVQGVVLLLLATRVEQCFARRDWAGGIALALIPFTVLPGALLALAAVLLPVKTDAAAHRWSGWLLLLAVVIAFQPFTSSISFRLLHYFPWVLIVGIQLVVAALHNRPRWLLAGAALAAAGALYGAAVSRTAAWPARLAAHFSLDVPAWTAPGFLGQRFGERSHPDALVLVPPTGEVWVFKLYARRAVVVDDKGTPYTDRGLAEWKHRMDQILGVPLTPGLDVSAAWRARTPEAIAATAAAYGARYVLTRDDDHPSLPGEVIDREGGWSLWMLSR